jgi:hypothetical protein
MAGIEKDHWLGIPGPMTQDQSWNVTLGLFNQWLRGELWPPARLLNLLPLVRLRTSPHSRHYGVTITGLLVTVFPAGHPHYGDARAATPSSMLQLTSLHECLHVHISFSWQTLLTAISWNHHASVQTMLFLAKIFVVLLS